MATDELMLAEEMIQDLMRNRHDQIAINKAKEICRWVFSFNEYEKHHRVKCYKRNEPSVSFCVDRGNDCNKNRIRTAFLVIYPDFTLHFKLIRTDYPYIRKDNNTKYNRINGSDARNLSLEQLQGHILDAYCRKLSELKIDSYQCNKREKQNEYKVECFENSPLGRIPTRVYRKGKNYPQIYQKGEKQRTKGVDL